MARFYFLLFGFISAVVFWGGLGLMTSAFSAPIVVSGAPDQSVGGACDAISPWGGVIEGKERWVPQFIDDDGIAHAYCDGQTGLVWEAAPKKKHAYWQDAITYCLNLTVEGDKGQKGWRLPSIFELATLVDTSASTCTYPSTPSLCLPDGNPFIVEDGAGYFSRSRTQQGTGLNVWVMEVWNGDVRKVSSSNSGHVWCVRAAMSSNGPF